ncbi:hypothetical protein [Leptolyngbya sp. FACHB-321]|nr:hypothetical protein [Leptolyngbya sp. FACHB-321]
MPHPENGWLAAGGSNGARGQKRERAAVEGFEHLCQLAAGSASAA